ncbi:hypothetical protein EHF_0779 [Ehrlichia japonica]|uniref:Uncharacterized protein n=1 Tax=Ehrlichia japonica TaxID=391036 RepID=X5GJ33_9RICK|nr:hypothetical protein EHF_0779 [Ehrlichia japonica]
MDLTSITVKVGISVLKPHMKFNNFIKIFLHDAEKRTNVRIKSSKNT